MQAFPQLLYMYRLTQKIELLAAVESKNAHFTKLKGSLHVKCVAALPCEIFDTFLTQSDKLSGFPASM